jgi:hypothetical protein
VILDTRRPDPPVGPVRVRIPQDLLQEMRQDLVRKHPYAAERIGYMSVGWTRGEDGEWILVAAEYLPLADDRYIDDPSVGARIDGVAIREGMQHVHDTGKGLFHVHMHEGVRRIPNFSDVDREEQPRVVETFRRSGVHAPHGMIVLGEEQANAWVWLPESNEPVTPEQIVVVGDPFVWIAPAFAGTILPSEDERYSRQSFLGANAQGWLETARFGVVGLGGGGSHVVQQLAHLGALRLRTFEFDHLDLTNLNRTVIATHEEARQKEPKSEAAHRRVDAILPENHLRTYGRWQEHRAALRSCDVVIGCVDTFGGRRDLEEECRRYGMVYLDIGMDIHLFAGYPPRMAGQLILSRPGEACMHCLGFLTAERIGQEAARYGDLGGRPQVVWPNGVLASAAVGYAVGLVTGWDGVRGRAAYLQYDGNYGTLMPHGHWSTLRGVPCTHFPSTDVGDVFFRSVIS